MNEEGPLRWSTERRTDGTLRIVFLGDIDEHAQLDELRGELAGRVELDLGGVARINSCGIREWVEFIRGLELESLVLVRCSPAFVLQLNAICNFRGAARIASILAPYWCEGCRLETVRLIELKRQEDPSGAAQTPPLPEVPPRCERCGGELEFDDLPERYFAFLDEPEITVREETA